MIGPWRCRLAAACLATLLAAAPAAGQEDPEGRLVEWQSANLAYLAGFSWQALPDDRRDVLTFEYANRWRFGDTFLFLDLRNLATRELRPAEGRDPVPTIMYAELQPRLSLGRILGICLCAGPVRDILTAHELNVSGGGLLAQLHGLGLAWRLPGFSFFKTNLYRRDNVDVPGSTWQLLVAGAAPFRIGGASFLATGYADFIGAEGPVARNVYAEVQLLWDVGGEEGRSGELYLGTEIHLSRNHLGREGVNQLVPQVMGKWVF